MSKAKSPRKVGDKEALAVATQIRGSGVEVRIASTARSTSVPEGVQTPPMRGLS